MGKKSYHHGDLRNAMLEGAYTMLMQEGINHLSLRKVAKHIGVSHNAPYQHFADKDALLAALAEDGFNKLSEMIETEVSKVETLSAFEQLRVLSFQYVQFMMRHPAYLEVMFSHVSHHEHVALSEAAIGSFERLVRIVEHGQATGEIKSLDARQIAGTIWMTLHGISTVFRNGKIPTVVVADRTAPELASDFVEIVCQGIIEPH